MMMSIEVNEEKVANIMMTLTIPDDQQSIYHLPLGFWENFDLKEVKNTLNAMFQYQLKTLIQVLSLVQ